MARIADEANKLRGGYYTPPAVARWLARWAIRTGSDRVLEPSCGDGVFLVAAGAELLSHRTFWEQRGPKVVGIELISSEAEKALTRLANSAMGEHAEVITSDFFSWLSSCKPGTFDVVLGNPPFIRYQHFQESSRSLAMQFLQAEGLHPNKLTNIWVPFVVGSAMLLHPGGRFAMVLPAELLQVTYAAQLRKYLAARFGRITIFACNQTFFRNAEQEVVLVLAEDRLPSEDTRNRCDISLVEVSNISELLDEDANTKRGKRERKYLQHDSEKWLKYFLDQREIELLRSLRQHDAVGTLGDHASVDIGVVTGKNEFFTLNQEQVDEYELQNFVIPLVGRSVQLPGTVLRKGEHERLGKLGKRVFLLHLGRHNDEQFSPGLRKFIGLGERNGFHIGYKCRIRQPWYNVPSVWEPDCFFFRQIYDFPRVVVNRAGATSTDTIHRMRCKANVSGTAANLYTHLTAASAEIEGRSYGGGVLELEPTEAERLLLPKKTNGVMSINEADKLVRHGRLTHVLEFNDRVVLQDALGLSEKECRMLKQIWSKMRDRRMGRRRR